MTVSRSGSMPRRFGPRGRSESEQEAGEPSVINLSFDGEVTNGADQKEPVKKVGLIVNFTQLTVSGFPVIARIKGGQAVI
jgi:hypothetical protein